MHAFRSMALLLVASVLTACGGGGGGDSSNNGFVVHLDRSSIALDFTQGETPSAAVVTATWTGEPPSTTIYVGAIVEGQGIDPAIQLAINNVNATATIRPLSSLATGDYSGRILILVCTDFQCNNRIGGSPLPIAYTVHVRERVLVNNNAIAFQHTVTGANAAGVSLSTNSSAGAWTASASASWITLSNTSGNGAGSLLVNYNATGLPDGTHNGTITVRSGDGRNQFVNVTLLVRPPTITTTLANIAFAGSLGVPIPNQSIGIDLDTHAAVVWSATSNANWLSLSRSSGSTPDATFVSFNLQNTPISGTYQAQIRFTATVEGRVLERLVPVNLNLSRPTLVFSGGNGVFAGVNGVVPPPQAMRVSLSNGLQLPISLSTADPWVFLGQSLTTDGNFTVGVGGATLSSMTWMNGSVLASVSLGGETITGSVIVQTRLDSPNFSYSDYTVHRSGVNGSEIPPQIIEVTSTPAVPFTMTFSGGPSWLTVTDISVGNAHRFEVKVDPSRDALASGSYLDVFQIYIKVNADTYTRSMSAQLELYRPHLTVTPSVVKLGGPTGRDVDSIPVAVSLDTGTKAHNWSVTPTGAAWLGMDRTSGAVSSVSQTVVFTPLPIHVSPGTARTSLTFSARVNGDTVTADVPVEFARDSHRIYAAPNGVAFVKTPSWENLRRSIKISKNYSGAGQWSATSDQSWLSITASGQYDGTLELIANPVGLAVDRFYSAVVTVTPATASDGSPEQIRVGFWVGSTSPSGQYSVTGDFIAAAADPVRPYIYAHGTNGDIRVFHLYTGTEESPIAAGVVKPGPMTASSDGQYLYVADTNDNTIVPITLPTRVANARWPAAAFAIRYGQLLYARPHGEGLLISSSGGVYRAATGATIGSMGSDYGISGDSTKAFLGGRRYDLDYSSADGGSMLLDAYGEAFFAFGYDTASNFDGSHVFTVDSPSKPFRHYNGLTMTENPYVPRDGDSQNVEIAPDGRAVLAVSTNYWAEDLWVYDIAGTLSKSFKLSDIAATLIAPRGVVISGDGFFIATPIIQQNSFLPIGAGLKIVPIAP